MATEARIAPERLEIQDDPSEADLRFVEDQVDEFNMAATGFRDIRRLAVFLRDAAGRIRPPREVLPDLAERARRASP
jgi:hypothetical protein